MADHKSAQKAIRKTESRTARNTMRRSRVRGFLKKAELAISGGKKKEAKAALVKAESEMMRAVSKGIFKRETASRKISRLSARVKALGK